MIRVLHILGGLKKGGIQSFLMNIYQSIDKKNIQFDFLITDKEHTDYIDIINDLGGKVYVITSRRKNIIKNFTECYKIIKNNNYQNIHIHCSSLSNIAPMIIAKLLNLRKIIVHSHSTSEGGSSIHKYIHLFNRIFVRYLATDYWACSEVAALWMFGKSIVEKGESRIINNGINVQAFSYNITARDNLRRTLKIPMDTFVMGHVGSFYKPKNQKFIIDIFDCVYKKHKNSILLLVGTGVLFEDMKRYAKKKGCNENIIFYGISNDISSLLSCMDVFIMPSLYEGMPVSLVEAQSSGLPCLVSENVEASEAKILDSYLKLPLSDSEDVWASMALVMYNKRDNREIAYKAVLDRGFDIEETVCQLERFYLE